MTIRNYRVRVVLAAPVASRREGDPPPPHLDLRGEWHRLADAVERSNAPIALIRFAPPTMETLRFALSPRAIEGDLGAGLPGPVPPPGRLPGPPARPLPRPDHPSPAAGRPGDPARRLGAPASEGAGRQARGRPCPPSGRGEPGCPTPGTSGRHPPTGGRAPRPPEDAGTGRGPDEAAGRAEPVAAGPPPPLRPGRTGGLVRGTAGGGGAGRASLPSPLPGRFLHRRGDGRGAGRGLSGRAGRPLRRGAGRLRRPERPLHLARLDGTAHTPQPALTPTPPKNGTRKRNTQYALRFTYSVFRIPYSVLRPTTTPPPE